MQQGEWNTVKREEKKGPALSLILTKERADCRAGSHNRAGRPLCWSKSPDSRLALKGPPAYDKAVL